MSINGWIMIYVFNIYLFAVQIAPPVVLLPDAQYMLNKSEDDEVSGAITLVLQLNFLVNTR